MWQKKKKAMGDLVNLRQARKRKERDEKAKKADQNRALHGRTRNERIVTDLERKNAEKLHDGHKRDGSKNPATSPEDISSDDASESEHDDNVVPIFSIDVTPRD